MSGLCSTNLNWSISESSSGSYLTGQHFLFGLDSAPGLLIARIAPPISYLNMGITRLLSKKHEGTGR